ncbi:MAG: protein kinase, partial [Nibricoccus sp.]
MASPRSSNDSLSDDAQLFNAALAMPLEERNGFITRACGSDAERRKRVEELLHAHEQSSDFLEEPLTNRLKPARALAAEIKTGDHIGPYTIVQKIGEGGCGAVYEAEQLEPVRRRVALKVIKLGMDTKAVVARFEAERQALALMDHPNIARVLDAGVTEAGRPFFVMELVRGIAITEYCDHNRLSIKQRLQLFIHVCRAVQHAHQKGVIHRDIKPSNILVTLHDGEPVPKVIDFGIAKATQGRLTEHTLFTAVEQLLGTPAYMSPEQALSVDQDVDTRSDIYSLGVLLYELLTGLQPYDPQSFKTAALDEVRRIIREVDPPLASLRLASAEKLHHAAIANHRSTSPGQLTSQLRGDLDWIAAKATEKDRARRYETVGDFAADVLRHLENEPVLARPPSTAYRVRKLVARYKTSFAAAAAILIILIVSTTLSTSRFLEERRSRQRAVAAEKAEQQERLRAQEALRTVEQERAQAELARHDAEAHRQTAEKSQRQAEADRHVAESSQREAEQARVSAEQARTSAEAAQHAALAAARDLRGHLYAADMFAVQALLREKGDLSSAQRILRNHIPRSGEEDLRGVEWMRAWQLSQGDQLLSWRTQQGIIRDLVFSPDERFLAIAGRGMPGEQGHIRVYDAKTRQPLADFIDAECVAFSADSKLLITVTNNGNVYLWHVGSWQKAGEFQAAKVDSEPNRRLEIAASPTNPIIAVCLDGSYGRFGGTVALYDYSSGKELTRFEDAGCRLAFTPDGKRLITGNSAQGLIKIWDISTGSLQKSLGPVAYVSSLAISPDQRWLAAFIPGKKAAVQLWTLKNFQPSHKLDCGEQDFLPGSVAFSPNADLVACGGGDKSVRIWRTSSGRSVSVLQGSPDTIWALVFSPDGTALYTGGRSDHISVWPTSKSSKGTETFVTMLAPARPELAEVPMFFSSNSKFLISADWERLTISDVQKAV